MSLKSLTISELDTVMLSAQSLVGARLQELAGAGSELGLGFWKNGEIHWWWLSLKPRCPVFLPVPRPLSLGKVKSSPIVLFLKAHAIGKRLSDVQRSPEFGRVVTVGLGREEDRCEFQFRLFPGGQNFIVNHQGKRVSLKKLQDLQATEDISEQGGLDRESRSLETMLEQFSSQTTLSGQSKGARAQKLITPEVAQSELKQQIKKKKRAIANVEKDLSTKQESQWRAVGDWLSENQKMDAPAEFQACIDTSQSFSWNLQNCYKKAKDSDRKTGGNQQRLTQLREELLALEVITDPVAWFKKAQRPVTGRSSLLKQVRGRGRTLALGDGLIVQTGKSARDNLALLRRAKAWDYWLHIKDIPSSHAIVQRNKGQIVSEKQLQQAARWLVEQSFSEKKERYQGQKFDVLAAECRYVRPIKGDKVGHVQYQNERVISVSFS